MIEWGPAKQPEPAPIRTTLHRPRTPGAAVERPRLLERLDAALVSASPGVGKTTLAVRCWKGEVERRICRVDGWPDAGDRREAVARALVRGIIRTGF